MIVLDASAAVAWLLHTPAGYQIEERIYSKSESLYAPHVIDLEVAQVFRRLVRDGTISSKRAMQALGVLVDLRFIRYPHFVLIPRIWQLRNNLSAYDAAYIALAELLGAALISCDAKLAAAPGHIAIVEIF